MGFDEQQTKETTTPIPILRYIDTQNPDGSYTYGYESGDGTYKIETRYATGEVKGKYGYFDDTGLLREVEYGATPTGGFNPSGSGLNLADALVAPAESASTATEADWPGSDSVAAVRITTGHQQDQHADKRKQPEVD